MDNVSKLIPLAEIHELRVTINELQDLLDSKLIQAHSRLKDSVSLDPDITYFLKKLTILLSQQNIFMVLETSLEDFLQQKNDENLKKLLEAYKYAQDTVKQNPEICSADGLSILGRSEQALIEHQKYLIDHPAQQSDLLHTIVQFNIQIPDGHTNAYQK